MDKRKDLYNDRWCVIGMKDNNTCFYADRSCTNYFEFSLAAALYIIERLKQNTEHGYNLIDYIYRKRIGYVGEIADGNN